MIDRAKPGLFLTKFLYISSVFVIQSVDHGEQSLSALGTRFFAIGSNNVRSRILFLNSYTRIKLENFSKLLKLWYTTLANHYFTLFQKLLKILLSEFNKIWPLCKCFYSVEGYCGTTWTNITQYNGVGTRRNISKIYIYYLCVLC